MSRNLVLVTVDCLRADHTGFLGYDRPTTPFLDELASAGIAAERAIVAGMPTYYSFPAILASRPPFALGRDVLGLAPGEPTLASALQDAGYATAAFVAGNPYLSPSFGYHQGFDRYLNLLDGGLPTSRPGPTDSAGPRMRTRLNTLLARAASRWAPARAAYGELYFRYCRLVDRRTHDDDPETLRRYPAANVVVDEAIAWLREARAPFFLWIHLMDPHHPYYPPLASVEELLGDDRLAHRAAYLNAMWNRHDLSPRRRRRLRDKVVDLYDAGIRWADTQLRRLSDALRGLGEWDRTVLAVTSDHGEEFLEHGGRYHDPSKLTQELVHVPLVLHDPGHPGPTRLEAPFSLLDLAPTLLRLLDVPPPATFHGTSTWNGVAFAQAPDTAVVTECVPGGRDPWDRSGWVAPRLLAVQDARFKLVVDFRAGTDTLFDLVRDPTEMSTLPQYGEPAVRRRLFARVADHLTATRTRTLDPRRIRAISLGRTRASLLDLAGTKQDATRRVHPWTWNRPLE